MFRRSTRFSEFQKSLGIATNILTRRLDRFVSVGLMEKRQSETGEHADYALTQKGLELKPVIIALTEWGDKWLSPGPIFFQTDSDGQPVKLELRRINDDSTVTVEDVIATLR
jgi:DNA-binding HxlR family transcriptional regulator